MYEVTIFPFLILNYRCEIKALTLTSCNSAVRGPWIDGVLTEGNHFPPHSLIVSSFPTLHFAPLIITSLPFKMLFQVYKPPHPSLASRFKQFGKSLDLNTCGIRNFDYAVASMFALPKGHR